MKKRSVGAVWWESKDGRKAGYVKACLDCERNPVELFDHLCRSCRKAENEKQLEEGSCA